MSTVPTAKSQISENPSKNAVTRAIDPKQKKEDVDRKMRFYGVIQAFREGRYPDNKQIDETLKYAVSNSPVDVKKLSPDGKKLIDDVRTIIETARQIVQEKNANEEFQNFLHASRKADVAGQVNVKAPVQGQDAKKDAETAGEAFRTLGKLFLRNGELRKLFQDVGLVGRDMFADLAVKAADVSRPDEDKLAAVDQPAPDNEFHDDIPETFKKAKKTADEAAATRDELANKGAQHADAAAQKGVDAADPDAPKSQEQAQQEGINQAKKAAEDAKQTVLSKIPQKHKDLVVEHKDKTVEYLKEKVPKERRDQFIYRLKKVVVECQRHRDYQDAIEFFLAAFEQYKGHAVDLHAQTEAAAANVRSESNVATAETTFRTLIERFANGKPTQPMLDALDQIYTDVKNDSELKDWFSRLDTYARKVLQEPGFIMKDEANTQARQLTETGKKFFGGGQGADKGKYTPHFETFFKEVEIFFTGMGEDPLNKKFGEDWKTLTRDLFLDAEGNAKFKPHLWEDIRDPILPELLQHIGYVPIPRIEYTDKTVDLVIENLTVEGQNLLPNILEVDMRNYFKLSQYKQLGDVHSHTFKVTAAQIQTDMRDVHFFINKKSGFPKLKDQGTADVFLGGSGLTITVHIEASSGPKGKKPSHVFVVKGVKAKVDKLNFAIRGSKHDLLIKILRPLATSLIKKQICKAAEGGIRDGLEKLDAQLVELRDRLDAAKKDPNSNQIDVLKDTFSKAESKAGSKAEAAGTFKFATNKRDSILPTLGHPDGWVNRIDEREQAAKVSSSNKEWHSAAFSIVGDAAKPGVLTNGVAK